MQLQENSQTKKIFYSRKPLKLKIKGLTCKTPLIGIQLGFYDFVYKVITSALKTEYMFTEEKNCSTKFTSKSYEIQLGFFQMVRYK